MKNFEVIAKERHCINAAIRRFFASRGFVEVETPVLVASPGMEPNLTPFETVVIESGGSTYAAGLITSPEYSMKKLLGQGMKKIFTLTKVFRNQESFGQHHNPEFTMLEWYMQGADYRACMHQTAELVECVAEALEVKTDRFEELALPDLFQELGVDLQKDSRKELQQICIHHNIRTTSDDTASDLFYRLFLEKIEPQFKRRNILVYNYPRYQAALAQLTDDGTLAQRFEAYMNGIELCNGFTELTNAKEQHQRFKAEAQQRMENKKSIFPIDEELLRLLPSIQSPTCGNALGVDRLHMVLTSRNSIEDVLLFPARNLFKN